MKDQYFADFGDYQKISLLKFLQREGFSIVLHWMRTKDDGSGDGKYVSYLSKPETWRSFDASIYDFLKKKLATGARSLTHIEKSEFCPNVEFLSGYIEDSAIREKYLEKILKSGTDVALFDPDNGIEVASTTKRTLHKYVTWNEIESAYRSGKSVIIYQHYPRANRPAFIKTKQKEIRRRISSSPFAIQVRHSAYLVIPQEKHKKHLRKAAQEFSRVWADLGVIH